LTAWQPTLVYLLFIPLTLLTTVGLETLVRKWYDLFPRNPYARILAVVPLTILIAGLGWTSISRFGLGQNYETNVVYHYSQEFTAVRNTLSKENTAAATLVVMPDDKAFYEILQRDFPKLKVVDSSVKSSSDQAVIVLASADQLPAGTPKTIITNSHQNDAVLLRVY
jgi:hypothetical protein